MRSFCSVLSRGVSGPNALPANLGKFMAAAMAPTTSNICSVVPRKSSSVKYRPQNRRTVAGATQYSNKDGDGRFQECQRRL